MTIEVIFISGLIPSIKSILEKPENMKELKELVSVQCGKEMNVKFVDAKEHLQRIQKQNVEEKVKNLDIPINIVD